MTPVTQETQQYANHVYRARAWSITSLISLLVVLALAFQAYQEPTYVSFLLVVLAGVVVVDIRPDAARLHVDHPHTHAAV